MPRKKATPPASTTQGLIAQSMEVARKEPPGAGLSIEEARRSVFVVADPLDALMTRCGHSFICVVGATPREALIEALEAIERMARGRDNDVAGFAKFIGKQVKKTDGGKLAVILKNISALNARVHVRNPGDKLSQFLRNAVEANPEIGVAEVREQLEIEVQQKPATRWVLSAGDPKTDADVVFKDGHGNTVRISNESLRKRLHQAKARLKGSRVA